MYRLRAWAPSKCLRPWRFEPLKRRPVPLRIFNTLTNEKQEFRPLRPGRIGIYVCGITVYDLTHVGHVRMLTAFDVAVRFLRFRPQLDRRRRQDHPARQRKRAGSEAVRRALHRGMPPRHAGARDPAG
ncbi:MAG: hypothetical protein E6J82_08970 [Deltaproteobacteria bacterium]|nr:MAG: hypothetical protein E6J82_08970 [Deltaproteobacteria bacterium]